MGARVRRGAERAATTARRVGTGVSEGFVGEAALVVADVRVVADIFRSRGAREGARVLRDGVRELGSSPEGTKDALKGAFITPIATDIKAGRHDRAVGRAAFHAATMIFPGDKVLRAASALVARSAEQGAN